MISLLARDPLSAFGLATVLETEKLPYRTAHHIDPSRPGVWLVAAADLDAAESELLRDLPCVVIGGGSLFAERVLGAKPATTFTGSCALSLDAPVWPATTRQIAATFHKSRLQIPLAPLQTTAAVERGQVLATLAEGGQPAIVQYGRLLWSAIDLGTALTHLLSESYLPADKQHQDAAPALRWLRHAAESVYYAAPAALRQRVQRASYARLSQRLAALGARATEYPADVSGWLLVELIKRLLLLARGGLVSLARWPAPFQAAATLTHDIEPRRYAYTTGLNRLLDTTEELRSPTAFGLVAQPCARHLAPPTAQRLQQHTVLCHGLKHRGETVSGRGVAENLDRARRLLESTLGRAVSGYRSPRLDRSLDLLSALDQLGFRYDSSYPDVDRENVRHFGGGVRFNLPFRPGLDDGGKLRRSRCLELPLTAPDCIQPLFGGASVAELEATIETKTAFVRATGGLYVALVHAGVFDDDDAAQREAHLRRVHGLLRHPDVWLADIEAVVDWWTAREDVRIEVQPGAIRVVNGGGRPIHGLQVVLESIGVRTLIAVPSLEAGADHVIELAPASDLYEIAAASPPASMVH
jgi:peptidoglycan/xylan/chitin deacetylase (PgdA/CDA1 family)